MMGIPRGGVPHSMAFRAWHLSLNTILSRCSQLSYSVYLCRTPAAHEISLVGQSAFALPIHMLMNTRAVYGLGCCDPSGHTFLFEHLFSPLLGTFLGAELLGRVGLF